MQLGCEIIYVNEFSIFFSELLLVDNKRLVKKGDVIKNEKYATTLERVRDDPESFYNGALASDILRDLEKVNGIWTDSDLSGYEHMEREPYQRELSGMKMYLTPPPTSGAVLGLILNILRGRSSRQNVIIIIIFIIVMIIVMIIVIIIIFLYLTRRLKNTVINIVHVAHIVPLPCAHTLVHVQKIRVTSP